MFQWFKRRMGARSGTQPRRSAQQRAQASQAEPGSGFGDSLALPEVVNEGNTPADWRIWEDSMTAVDSMLQGISPSARVYVRTAWPSQFDEVDPFGRALGKNSKM
jgi:hypothetical protein